MEDFIERLRHRLAEDLPGQAAQFLMAPVGRSRAHPQRGAIASSRQSAVLLYLYLHQEDWRLVLMKRPHYDGVHSGQISIPGGCLEQGEEHSQAALREFEEETGVRVHRHQLLGDLSELFIPASNFVVRPYVAYATQMPNFFPDPVEVERIIELRLPVLLRDDAIKQGKVHLADGVQVETPYFEIEDHRVWGATAMILSEFKEIVRDMVD